jgi:hypothetical protein
MDTCEILITLNNEKLNALKIYEKEHRESLVNRHVYYAVVHEIENLEKQNQWLFNESK